MGWQGKKSANVECVQLGGSCSLLQMLNGDEARILNEANLHGVNQNRICFTYQRFHAQTHPLGSARAEAWCNSSINQEASAAPVGYTANTLHAHAVSHWQALRFHPVLRRCLKGFITVAAPLQHSTPPTPPPFSSSSLSEVSFFFPLLVPFPSLLSSGVLLRVPLKAHSGGLAPITAFTTPRSVHQG